MSDGAEISVGTDSGSTNAVESKSASQLPRVDPRGLTDALLQQARTGSSGRGVELKFALHPEELGPVQVRMESRDGRLRIRIVAASSSAAEAIGRDLPRLIEGLRDLNGETPDVELDWDEPRSSDGRESRRDSTHRGRAATNPTDEATDAADGEEGAAQDERDAGPDSDGDRGLDRVA